MRRHAAGCPIGPRSCRRRRNPRAPERLPDAIALQAIEVVVGVAALLLVVLLDHLGQGLLGVETGEHVLGQWALVISVFRFLPVAAGLISGSIAGLGNRHWGAAFAARNLGNQVVVGMDSREANEDFAPLAVATVAQRNSPALGEDSQHVLEAVGRSRWSDRRSGESRRHSAARGGRRRSCRGCR